MSTGGDLLSELIKTVEKTSSVYSKSDEQTPILLNAGHSFETPKSITVNEYFPKIDKLSNTVTFPQKLANEKIVNPEIIPKINEIIEKLSAKEEIANQFYIACEATYRSLSSIEQKYDIIASLLIISCQISKKFNISAPSKLATSSLIFDPSYIVGANNSLFIEQINTLRTLVIDSLVYGDANNAKSIFYNLLEKPQLFAEYANRLVSVQMQLNLSGANIQVLTHALMYGMTYYQTLENLTEAQQKAVCEARMGILLLLNNYLSQNDLMIKMFNEAIFIESFFSQMYEPAVAPFVISHITRYMGTKDSQKNEYMMEKIMSIAKYVAHNLSNENVVEIGASLYSLIISSMMISTSQVDYFSSLINDLINGIVSIVKCQAADNFLACVIQMITIAKNHTLTTPEVMALQTAITTVFNGEPSQQIFVRILQLIAGTPIASISPTFPILQPKALRLLLTAFLSSNLIESVVDFVAKLLQASIENCEAAHYGGFDICIIDILFALRTSDMSKKVLVAKLYSLLMLIATQISSVAVVRKFVSLLNPIEGRALPFYHQISVKLLNNMLQSSKKKPVAVIPLQANAHFDLGGVTGEDIENGFTLSMWLFVNSKDPKYKSQLVIFNDTNGDKIGVFLTGNSVILLLEKNGDQWSAKPEVAIPMNEWFNLNVSFVPETRRNQLIINTSVDQSEARTLFFPLVQLHNGPLSVKVGGHALDSISVSRISMMGPFGVFPVLQTDQIISMVDSGPQGSIPSNIHPVFYMIPREVDGYVHLMEASRSKVTSITQSIKYSHTLSFAETLVIKCGIDTLLPLFAQWDLPFTNNEHVQYLPEMTIDVLENCLALSEEAQTIFAEGKGFKIISHLIRSADEKNITYALYCRLFALMGVITSEVAQKSLINDVLMNVEIWIHSDATDHLRIIKHWARVLCPSKKFTQMCDFGFLLSILRIYYWYESDPQNAITKYPKRCRGQKLNVSECRKGILAVAHMVVRAKFTADDFKLLMSHILTVGALQQNIDLLYFLRELIDDPSVPLAKSESPVELIALLQYLFNLKNEVVVSSLIATVIDAHRKNLFTSMSIVDHLDIILHQLTATFVSKSLLITLVGMAGSNVPELFPICSWMAANIGNKALKYLLTNLKAGSQYNLTHNWCQWLVVAMYKADAEMKRSIIKFLIESSGKNLGQLFAIVDVIGHALGESVDTAKHAIIQEAGKLVVKGNDNVSLDEYVKILKHFVFFREGEEGSLALQSLYQNSPFVDSKPPKVRMHHNTPPRNLCSSPKKKLARKARHSLHPSAIIQFTEKTENYSPLLAEQALAALNPISQLVPDNMSFKSRRVSMLTMGPRKYDYETHREPDKKVVSMMPGDLDKKIAEVAEKDYIYTFGLRFSKSGQWLDIDLADQFLEIFTKFPDPKYAPVALSLASYMVRFESQFIGIVCQVLPKNDALINSGLSLIAHHGKVSEIEVPVKASEATFEPSSFEFIQKLPSLLDSKDMKASSLRMLKKTLRIQTTNSQRAYNIFGMITDQLVIMSSNAVNDDNDKIAQHNDKSEKYWRQFWQCNTVDHAPWFNSLPPSIRSEVHYKRDNVLCPLMIPLKMKRNYNYTDHKDASLLRDTGSTTSAEKALEKYKKELQEEYEKNAPAQLFEVKEETNDPLNDSLDAEAREEKKYTGSDCIIELPCEIIKNNSVKKATFALLADAVVITYESGRIKVIDLKKITGLFFRTRFHHPTGMEIYTMIGKTYFINFPNIRSIPILKHFRSLDMPLLRMHQYVEFKPFADEFCPTRKWINGEMSNFEYLMKLNLFSGRTFNDVSQYPVVPWVLCDYESKVLDLSNPSVFRDLSKPIGAIDEERLQMLLEKRDSFIGYGLQPYLFSSGYSCPLSVYLWLLRMEPFSSLHIDIQSGKFDHAARLFSSIAISWKLSTTHQNDFRELIPEFYSQPEFLQNLNGFDLGKVDGVKVNDVVLPPWADSPYDFIYKNRKALESEYVSENLNKWIDLVWGYKQSGKEAEKANNIFVPQMYPSIWTDEKMKDPLTRAETEAILCHVGQVPPKLFNEPHPERMNGYMKASSLARPVSISLGTKSIMSSSIVLTQSKKFKITTLDETGLINTSVFDAANLNKLSKNILSKPRSRSDSDKVLSATPDNSWKSHRRSAYSLAKSELVEIPVGDFNSSSKTVKQFQAVKPTKDVVSTIAVDGSIFFVGAQPNELYRIIPAGSNISLALRQRSSITSIASDGVWLMTANNDAVISLYSIYDSSKPKFTIPSFTSSIKSCAISSSYHQAVCGTKDSTLIIASLSDSCITRVVDLKGRRPIKILITQGWGFIVVYNTDLSKGILTHYITVFNINGEMVRDVEIPVPVHAWSSYMDAKGFDYIVMADDQGSIYHFEAFYANIGESVFSVPYEIKAMKYLVDECIIIAVTSDGRAIFIPSLI